MKVHFTVSCLLAISTIFATPVKQAEAYLIEDETAPVFQRYLTKCRKNNMANQPVYLRNASREKSPSSSDTIILNLDPPSTMQINDVAEHILYGDADVVHLRNISTNTASHLYELLKQDYTHFIHVPYQEKGLFVASKYPILKQAEVIRAEQENAPYKDVLKFTIHEDNICSACVSTNDLSIQVANSSGDDDNVTTPILLADLPGTFSVLKPQKQQFSPLQLAERADLLTTEMFEILPVKGGGSNESGGSYSGGRIDVSFGSEGTSVSVSAFAGVQDNHGNYAEVDITRNDNGTISIGAEAGHDNNK